MTSLMTFFDWSNAMMTTKAKKAATPTTEKFPRKAIGAYAGHMILHRGEWVVI